MQFSDLEIDERIKNCLNEISMTTMTPIQAKCIPELLTGVDLMGAAKTGSGKTLAFLVPLVHKLLQKDMPPNHGTGAIVLSPTRELSQQIFDILTKLLVGTNIKSRLITGGKNRNLEAKDLRNGVTVIVATPGRLKDHLLNTNHFLTHLLHTLVIDEADRLMEQGFYDDMRVILAKLPSVRQTVLFSATLDIGSDKFRSKIRKAGKEEVNNKMSIGDKVLSLANLCLKKNVVFVDISTEDLSRPVQTITENKVSRTVEQLKEVYIIPDPEDRFVLLMVLIKKWKNQKVMVFMSTNDEVKYYFELLSRMKVSVLALYGHQTQSERERNFAQFKSDESSLILCTDVAARGLDIPKVDLVIQYDPPRDYKDYIHRVGRTARAGRVGEALLFLRPHEKGFLGVLQEHNIHVSKMVYDASLNPKDLQEKIKRFVTSSEDLVSLAVDAYVSLTNSYATCDKRFFDFNILSVEALSINLGLEGVPRVLSNVSRKRKRKSHQDNVASIKEPRRK